ncbi:hypothetical protein [Macrococcus animalis]|uniref:hypothetical protein n=1 Tax=Macrococcus animalis TaxID=3395467 RepID=UPI0039BDFE44
MIQTLYANNQNKIPVEHLVKVEPSENLMGTDVYAKDVRAGIALIYTTLLAEGTTRIFEVKHIFRGYEDIITDFKKLGITIVLEEFDETKKKSQ